MTSEGLDISYRGLAWVLGIGCVGLGGATVFLWASKDADSLTVVALAIAIGSFAGQFWIFGLQQHQAESHLSEARRLNAETPLILSEVRVLSQTTRTSVDTHMSLMLDVIRDKAEVWSNRDRVNGVVREASKSLEAVFEVLEGSPATKAGQADDPAFDVVEGLDQGSLDTLGLAALDDIVSRRGGLPAGWPLGPGDDALLGIGALAPVDDDRVRLSPYGASLVSSLLRPSEASAPRAKSVIERMDPWVRQQLLEIVQGSGSSEGSQTSL